MKTKCEHKSKMIDFGGTITYITEKGLVIKQIKGKGLKCLDCKQKIKI